MKKFWATLALFMALFLFSGGWLFKLQKDGVPVKSAIFDEYRGKLKTENLKNLKPEDIESAEGVIVIKRNGEEASITLYGNDSMMGENYGETTSSIKELFLQLGSGSGNAYAGCHPHQVCTGVIYMGKLYTVCKC